MFFPRFLAMYDSVFVKYDINLYQETREKGKIVSLFEFTKERA